MQAEKPELTPVQLALSLSKAAADTVGLIDESLLILSEKRRTLEEKEIFRYFHRLAAVYANIIAQLHTGMHPGGDLIEPLVDLLYRLRTVNENVRSCVEELLKILKYDFNYLEQYFEHDYVARLLNNQAQLLGALEALETEFKSAICEKAK